MRNQTKFALSLLTLALSSSMAAAQEDNTGFTAKADTTIGYDDNIYRVTDELANSDNFLTVAPVLNMAGGFGKQRFELAYDGEYTKFSDSEDADYYDHNFQAKAIFDHTLRFGSRFEVGYSKEHEDPGSINRIQLNITEYNKYNQNYFLAGLTYGQASSIGQIAFNYRRTDRDYYTNNLDFLDFVNDQITGRFTYRIAPKTRIYLEAVISDIDYDPPEGFTEIDNKYKRYKAGLSWDFTNKLSGDVNVGYQDRNYEVDGLQDISGLAYDGNITWSMNTYTKLVAEAKRESVDSSLEDTGGFLRTSYSLSLQHELTELLKLNADLGYGKDEFVFNQNRQDKRLAYQFGLEYEVLRFLSVSANYMHQERDSTLATAEFDANVISLIATFTLED